MQLKVAGATRERMLREMAEALEALSAERPLVLLLEDMHWSDVSTIELLSMLARRQEAARLLVLATYRPADVIVSEHPLKRVKQKLVTRGLAVELPLPYLGFEAVQTYTRQQGALRAESELELASLIYDRTEGQPLFMVQLLADLVQQGAPLSEARRVLPPGLQHLLIAQIERLTADEQEVLAAGSVGGAEFSVASVTAGLERSSEEIGTVCEELVRRGQFLVERELVTWPDGTVSGRCGFRHALYQEVLYQRLNASRRALMNEPRLASTWVRGMASRCG